MTAMHAHTNTAPAAISFTCPAMGCLCGETRSTNLSMAVLKSSALITMPIHRRITSHSVRVIWNRNPAMMTNTVAIR